MLPLLALGAMLAVQYFAPPKAQTEEPAAEQAAIEQAAEADDSGFGEAAQAQISPVDARSRADSQSIHQLHSDRIIASFTDLNTALVSLKVKGERYLDDEGNPFELVTTQKEQYLPLGTFVLGREGAG